MTVSEKERLLDTQTIIHYSETGPKVRQKKARSAYVMSVPFPTDKATRGSGLAEVAQADKFSLTNLDQLSWSEGKKAKCHQCCDSSPELTKHNQKLKPQRDSYELDPPPPTLTAKPSSAQLTRTRDKPLEKMWRKCFQKTHLMSYPVTHLTQSADQVTLCKCFHSRIHSTWDRCIGTDGPPSGSASVDSTSHRQEKKILIPESSRRQNLNLLFT